MRDGHCSQPQQLLCEDGCAAFLVTEADIRPWSSPRVRRPPPGGPLRDERIKGSASCSGQQERASFCRLRPAPGPKAGAKDACRRISANYRGVNLMNRVQTDRGVLLAPMARRKGAVLAAGTAKQLGRACPGISVSWRKKDSTHVLAYASVVT